jgi:nitrate/TMAO reductase-like tetraheme cytochrome c subunit
VRASHGPHPGSQSVGHYVAEARVSAWYDGKLKQLDNERQQCTECHDAHHSETGQTDAEPERQEEENVVQHVDAAILAAYQAPE